MRHFGLICLLVLSAALARAEWADLKEGIDQKMALQLVGPPLLQSRVRNGTVETWTYDAGGYIQFDRGRVRYWQAPKAAKKPVRKG